jgi:small-conductance mechanosensitive channel
MALPHWLPDSLASWLAAVPAVWLPTLGAALMAVVLAEAVFRVGVQAVKRATRGSAMGTTVSAAIRAPAHALLPLLALHPVWQGAADALPGLTNVQRLTTLAMLGALTWLCARAVHGVARAVLEAHPLDSADNLEARRVQTQTRVLSRLVQGMVIVIGLSLMLMTFPAVRQVGASLLASAGVLGIVAGFAARPVLGNLIAGLQIGLSQPIRIDDVVIVENEWGVIEEITGTYVVVRIWDQRRLVVPLQYWIEKPFQNWTRTSSELIGTVFLWVDYRMPLQPLRDELQRACEASPHWDKRLAMLQVTEAGPQAMQLRCLVTAASAPAAWDLRCEVREALVGFVQRDYPQYLPRGRGELEVQAQAGPLSGPLAGPARAG